MAKNLYKSLIKSLFAGGQIAFKYVIVIPFGFVLSKVFPFGFVLSKVFPKLAQQSIESLEEK